MEQKYRVIPYPRIEGKMTDAIFDNFGRAICFCADRTIAEKICNLLNETSRSQGKWPK